MKTNKFDKYLSIFKIFLLRNEPQYNWSSEFSLHRNILDKKLRGKNKFTTICRTDFLLKKNEYLSNKVDVWNSLYHRLCF